MRPVFASLILATCTIGGCASSGASGPAYPPTISHVVLAKLNNPGDAVTLFNESREKLSGIPGVRFYAQGPHFETGRPTVEKDYDVALLMGFDTPEDYQRYVDHPRHVEFVKTWRPRLQWLRVYDVHTRSAPH